MSQTPSDASGRHEPPTKRSFYFSLGTSTLRAIILVAAVVVGVLLLKNAFPSNATAPLAPGATNTSPSHSPSPHRPGRSPSPKAPVRGVVVEVRNGTSQFGLAAATSQTLRSAGYTVRTPGNAALASTTVIYYRADSKAAAQYLQQRYFPGAQIKPAPGSVPHDVNLEVILGSDQVGASSSP